MPPGVVWQIDPATGLHTTAPKKPAPAKPDTSNLFAPDPVFPTGPKPQKRLRPGQLSPADKAYNAMIEQRRHAAALQAQIAARVSSTAGLAPVGGLGQKGAAKDLLMPDVAPKVGLAKANLERRSHGGLLTPEQSRAEKANAKLLALSNKPSFADTHQLPDFMGIPLARPHVRLSPGESNDIVNNAFGTPPPASIVSSKAAQPAPPEQQRFAAGRGRFVTGDRPAGGNLGSALTSFLSSVDPEHIKRLVEQNDIGGIGGALRMSDALMTGSKLASKVLPKPDNSPSSIPHRLIDVAKAFDPAAQAANKGQPVFLDQLSDKQRFGAYVLTPQARKPLVLMATNNGYAGADAPTWNDAELVARAFGPKKEYTVGGYLQNAAQETGELSNLTTFPVVLGRAGVESVQQQSPVPLLRMGATLAQQYSHLLPGPTGDRPWLENLYDNPINAPMAILPVAKGLSLGLGKALRMPTTREVTLPSSGKQMTVPASQELATRGLQAVGDRILAKGLNPVARATRPRHESGVRNIPGDLARGAMGGIHTIGHRMERTLTRQALAHDYAQARRLVGQDSYLAHSAYATALRRLPFMRHVLKGHPLAGKENEFESLVLHGLSGKSSAEISAFYKAKSAESTGYAQELEAKAAAQQQLANEMRASPDPMNAAQHRAAEANAKGYLEDAAKLHATAKDQLEKAAFSDKFPLDLNNLSKQQKAVIEAAKSASRLTTNMKLDAHLMSEKGALFGALQYHLGVTHAIGDHASPEWQAADAIMRPGGLRDAHNTQRDILHGQTNMDEATPSTADAYSPEALHHLGRYQTADKLITQARDQAERRDVRLEQIAARTPPGSDPVAVARAAATHAGVDPGKIDSLISDATFRLGNRREYGQHGANVMDTQAADELAKLTRVHETASSDTLTRLRRELDTLQTTNANPSRISAKEREIRRAERDASQGAAPNETHLSLTGQAEKMRARSDLEQLNLNEATSTVSQHLTHAEMDAIGRQRVIDALQYSLDNSPHLDRARVHLTDMREDAASKFSAASGHDASAALEFRGISDRYVQALRGYQGMLEDQGITTAHLHMHDPRDPYNSDPVMVSHGEQFPRGNYTADMHFFIAKDLDTITRRAVEAKFFELLGDRPFIIHNPEPGSVIPPGFIRVSAEDYSNLLKTNRNADATKTMLDEWKGTKERQPGSETIPHDGEPGVLISRDTKEFIEDQLKRGGPDDISAWLQATNKFRRWLLFSLPRTWVNNAVGNPVLASIQGAGIRTWLQSVHILRNHPDYVPGTLMHRGVSGGAMGEGGASKMSGWQAFWRHQNTFQEDLGNVMVYMLHAKKAFKDQQGLRWFNKVNDMTEHWGEFLKDAANGKNPDAAKWSAKSADMFGDMARMSKHDNLLASAFTFHRWVGHMLRLTFLTMPFKYPGRMLMIQQMSQMANQYRKEHGLFPEWAKGMIPLFDQIDKLTSGANQTVTWALDLNGIDPFSTPGQTFDLGTPAQAKFPGQALLGSNLTPPLRIAAEQLMGQRMDTGQPFKDYHGNVIDSPSWRVIANSIWANTPIASSIFSRTSQSDDSLQFWPPSRHQRFQTASKADASLGSPSPFGHGVWADIAIGALGAAGVRVRPVDAQGQRARLGVARTTIFQDQQRTKRLTAQGQETSKMLTQLTPEARKSWYKQHDPAAFKRLYPNG